MNYRPRRSVGKKDGNYSESVKRFEETGTVFAVLGRNNLFNSMNARIFTSREAADLWASNDSLNDNDDWQIHEVPLLSLAERQKSL
jgi:hypothetical protein